MEEVVDNDRVLVIIQLQGGNDGLNTVIPIEGYNNYYNARSNIAINQNRHTGSYQGRQEQDCTPPWTGLRTMFNEKKLGIIQGVGYPAPNFSHFRATDIWMSASDSNRC